MRLKQFAHLYQSLEYVALHVFGCWELSHTFFAHVEEQ